MKTKEIFGVRELTDYLGLSEKTVRNLIKDKEIPYFKIKSLYKFSRESIDAWVRERISYEDL